MFSLSWDPGFNFQCWHSNQLKRPPLKYAKAVDDRLANNNQLDLPRVTSKNKLRQQEKDSDWPIISFQMKKIIMRLLGKKVKSNFFWSTPCKINNWRHTIRLGIFLLDCFGNPGSKVAWSCRGLIPGPSDSTNS